MTNMLLLPSLPFLLISLLFLFLVVKLFKTSRAQDTANKLPPGPWRLPIIGNLHQLMGSLPHHSLRDLAKKYGPVMHLKLGEVSAVVISSPEPAEEVLKTNDLVFAQRPSVLAVDILSYDHAGIVFSSYGEGWRQMRKICVLELLSAKRVQSFRSIREQEVGDLIESIYLSREVAINLSDKIFSLTNSVTSRAAFGKRCKDQGDLLTLFKEAITLSGGFNLPDLFPSVKFLGYVTGLRPKLERIHRKIDKILDDMISEHKLKRTCTTSSDERDDQEDLIDVLLNLQETSNSEFQVTTNHIKSVIVDVLSAGSDTWATTIEWAMSELLRNPRVMERAQAEVRQVFAGKTKFEERDILKLEYLKAVIKETLRLHPPAMLLTRESRERCEIGGYEIPAKMKIFISSWAIGRNPISWTDADSFQPKRFLGSSTDFKGLHFEFIPFGAGRRICPGILYSSANIELAVAKLLYHFDWKLPNGVKPEDLDMTENFGLTTRRRNDLYVIATPCTF